MKSSRRDKISIYRQLLKAMEQHLNKWGKIVQFKSSYDEFVLNTERLEELMKISEKSLSQKAAKVQSLRNEVISQLNPVSQILALYAHDKNEKGLKRKAGKATNKLETVSGPVLNKRVEKISLYAEKRLHEHNGTEKTPDHSLESYGLTTGLIEALKQENEKHRSLRISLKTEQKNIDLANKEIDKKIKQNDQIIKNRFKKFMSLFKNTDAAFYQDFEQALSGKPDKKPEISRRTRRKTNSTTQGNGKPVTQKSLNTDGRSTRSAAKKPGSTSGQTRKRRTPK